MGTLVVYINLQIYTLVGGKKWVIVKGLMTDPFMESFLSNRSFLQPPAALSYLILSKWLSPFIGTSFRSFLCCSWCTPSLKPPAEHGELQARLGCLPVLTGQARKTACQAQPEASTGSHVPLTEFCSVKHLQVREPTCMYLNQRKSTAPWLLLREPDCQASEIGPLLVQTSSWIKASWCNFSQLHNAS